jgi:peptide methionine sulfoxide reductase MsrA
MYHKILQRSYDSGTAEKQTSDVGNKYKLFINILLKDHRCVEKHFTRKRQKATFLQVTLEYLKHQNYVSFILFIS